VTVDGDYNNFDACQSNAPEDGFRFWLAAPTTPTNDVVKASGFDVRSGIAERLPGNPRAGVDCMQNQAARTCRHWCHLHWLPDSDVQTRSAPQRDPTTGSITLLERPRAVAPSH
jgi:hypothetical protein